MNNLLPVPLLNPISGDDIGGVDVIGAKFGTGEITSNTAQSHADNHRGWYDQAYPAKK